MKALCRLPFEHVFINNAGTLHACCVVYPQYTKLDEFGFATRDRHVASVGLAPAWQSASMQALRQQMKNGQWPTACATCRRQEEAGLPSRRTREGQGEPASNPNEEFQIRTLDLRLGNTCNLACRMCSPFSSNLLLKEWTDETPSLPPPSRLMQESVAALGKQYSPIWEEDPKFWSDLLQLAPNAEEIHFAGGEPFLNRAHVTYLESLIQSGRSREIRLSYNTNLTVVPGWLTRLAEQFREVRILVSLDGVEAHAEYIRYPLKWTNFVSCLEKLEALKAQFPEVISVAFNTTLQVYTLPGLPDLMLFLETHPFENLPRETTPNVLHHPAYFDLAELPDEQKTAALELIEQVRQKVSRSTSQDFLSALGTQLLAKRQKDPRQTWDDFCQVTRRYDLQRKQDFSALATWTKLGNLE